MRFLQSAGFILISLAASTLFAADEAPATQGSIDYLRDVKPLLTRRCSSCHGALKQESELRLDTAKFALKGGEGGEVIIPGKSAESSLIEAVTGDAGYIMPPEGAGKPLSKKDIAILKNWIDQGAKGPVHEKFIEDPKKHWSYQPVIRPRIPEVKNRNWVQNPIDAFIAARHETLGLQPRPVTNKSALLRRVSLDLIGLPPTREELHAFLADPSDKAYEKAVDRLLNSKHHGERWGRHWMDVWRYSDWYGRRSQNEIRYSQYHIWRWRDWIVESLNADKGYDRMIVEMLAGDEVAPNEPDTIRATGFLARNWYKFNRSVWLQETIEHTSMGFLGLTMKCARCHDHKFDPIQQKEYYRLRAFFEPHDVRTDPVPGQPDIKKDGLARVFDAKIKEPTYLFSRGDDRFPDKEHPLTPGVPASLDRSGFEVKTVSLPVESFYPALKPDAVKTSIAQAETKIATVRTSITKSKAKIAQAKLALDEVIAAKDGNSHASETAKPFLVDDFSKPNPDLWQVINGKWDYKNGKLVQSQDTSFATLMLKKDHPRNFKLHLKYTHTPGGKTRSIGLSFDATGKTDSQDIYTSANDTRTSVHAFHRTKGKQVYPRNAIIPCEIKVGKELLLDIVVQDSNLKISVDGQLKLDYTMPVPRRDGRLALWVHNGTATFDELRIEPLRKTRTTLEQELQNEQNLLALTQKKLVIAQAELAALNARTAAERAKHTQPATADTKQLALSAGKAERQVALLQSEYNLLEAEQQRASILSAIPAAKRKGNKTLADAESKVTQSKKAVATAQSTLNKEDPTYKPLGEMYPQTSTGRRLALARWIANSQNPRTARVAVNHIWRRHFGAPIVPSMADFGLRSKPRTHPKLLDWLSDEFIKSGWSMKHLHRLIVTSNAYRMKSSAGNTGNPNLTIDKDNRYLWRMNSRRMEAEIVRDSVLYTSGQLDTTQGGPELAETLGQTSRRKSLYFRTTPDSKMPFLELFDLANPNECYERRESVIPQQALALSNSPLSLSQARLLAQQLSKTNKSDESFINAAFEQVLTRLPTNDEMKTCQEFLNKHTTLIEKQKDLNAFPAGPAASVKASPDPRMRAKENLVHVLFSHNDFVTIR